jgi:hypothetical protein
MANSELMGDYPLVICYIASENGWKWHIEIVDLPNLKMVIFHRRCYFTRG